MLEDIRGTQQYFLGEVEKWQTDIRQQFALRFGGANGAGFDNSLWEPTQIGNYRYRINFGQVTSNKHKGRQLPVLTGVWLSLAKCFCYKVLLVDKKSYRPAAIISVFRYLSQYCAERSLAVWDMSASTLDDFCRNSGIKEWAWSTVKALHVELSSKGLWAFKFKALISEKKKRFKTDYEVDDLRERVLCLLKLYDQIDDVDKDGQRIFSDLEVMAICFMMLCFAAPVRFNEVLSLHVDALVDVTDFQSADSKADGETHPYWVLYEKGSKGADSKAKVVIAQMIEVARDCFARIKQMNKRRREFVAHYESHFEHPLSVNGVGNHRLYTIEELERLGIGNSKRGEKNLYSELTSIPNAIGHRYENTGVRGDDRRWIYRKIYSYQRPDLCEESRRGGVKLYRIEQVLPIWRKFFASSYAVAMRALSTPKRVFQNPLSQALFISPDSHSTRFAAQPSIIQNVGQFFGVGEKNLFKKVDIRYVGISGKIEFPTISSHEIRHWLTNEAKRSNKLSDDLVNMWTGRRDIRQMSAYQHLTEAEKAALLDIPTSAFHQIELTTNLGDDAAFSLRVLDDKSELINTLELLRERQHIKVQNDSGKVVNVTPWGWCSHEAYELPCIKLKESKCVGCGDLWVVKGDSKTNKYLVEKNEQAKLMMLAQAKYLLKNRLLFADEERLVSHIETLLDKYCRNFEKRYLEELSDFILDNFSKIQSIQDNESLRDIADTAWIIRGFCRLLNDDAIEVGAGIRYNGKERYFGQEIPGIVRAIESKGVAIQRLLDEEAVLFLRHENGKDKKEGSD